MSDQALAIHRRAAAIAGSLRRERAIRSARPRADRELRRLAGGSRPLVAGPWLGEVGFELLYWIPLLRWLREELGVEAERLTVISRGGADGWYEGLAGRYLDALDFATPEELRAWIGTPGGQKARSVSRFERDLLARMAPELGEPGDYDLLHPSLLYALHRRYWRIARMERPISDVLSRSRFAPLPAAADPPERPHGLPEDYVAVKAYFSPVLPETDESVAFVRRLIARLAERNDVVLLGAGARLDDHGDVPLDGSERISTLAEVEPRRNLALQTAAVRHARALVATYGGFSYLGPMVGVDSLNFCAVEGHNPAHLDVMDRAIRSLARGDGTHPGFTFARTADLDRIAGLGGVFSAP